MKFKAINHCPPKKSDDILTFVATYTTNNDNKYKLNKHFSKIGRTKNGTG